MSVEDITKAFLLQLQGKDEMIGALLDKVDSLEKTNGELPRSNSELADVIKEQNASIQQMSEELGKLRRMMFGTSSEKTHAGKKGGGESAEDDEGTGQSREECGEASTVEPDRDRRKEYRRPDRREYSDINEEKVTELRPDAEDIKGARLLKVTHTYKFYYIPGRLCKVRIDCFIYHKDGHLITPELPYAPDTFHRRMASPELSAWLPAAKYYYHIPYERILKMLNASSDIKIARSTHFDWANAGAEALEGFYESIREKCSRTVI